MTDRPWYPWYPQDIRGERTYKLCTAMARLVWRECLDLMHDAPRRGYLLGEDGKPLTPNEIGVLIGLPTATVKRALDELRSRQTCGWDEAAGAIFSRRMVRDEQRSRRNADNGKQGGNPKLTGSDKSPDKRSDNRPSLVPDKASDNAHAGARDRVQNPESRNQIPEPRDGRAARASRGPLMGSHLNCATHCAGFCVPHRLNEKLVGLCRGMDPADAQRTVDAFYVTVEADPRWQSGPVGTADVFRFLQDRWEEAHGGAGKKSARELRADAVRRELLGESA